MLGDPAILEAYLDELRKREARGGARFDSHRIFTFREKKCLEVATFVKDSLHERTELFWLLRRGSSLLTFRFHQTGTDGGGARTKLQAIMKGVRFLEKRTPKKSERF